MTDLHRHKVREIYNRLGSQIFGKRIVTKHSFQSLNFS